MSTLNIKVLLQRFVQIFGLLQVNFKWINGNSLWTQATKKRSHVIYVSIILKIYLKKSKNLDETF